MGYLKTRFINLIKAEVHRNKKGKNSGEMLANTISTQVRYDNEDTYSYNWRPAHIYKETATGTKLISFSNSSCTVKSVTNISDKL
jgi:hypothetical protein